jgi:hypothetical protein
MVRRLPDTPLVETQAAAMQQLTCCGRGQLLSSNGSGAAASWVSPAPSLYNNSQLFSQTTALNGIVNYVTVPGLTQNFTSPVGKAMFILKGNMKNDGCFGCGDGSCKYDILVDGILIDRNIVGVSNGSTIVVTNGAILYNVSAGTHTVTVNVDGNGGNFSAYGFRIVVIVLPQ